MKPLSMDLRTRIVESHEQEGQSYTQVAARFHVSRSSVKRLVKQWRNTGQVAAKPASNGSRPMLDASDEALLKMLIEQQGDRSQDELRDQIAAVTGKMVSQPTLCRTLQRVRVTRKKRPSERRNSSGPTSRKLARRLRWR
jgi:transposase